MSHDHKNSVSSLIFIVAFSEKQPVFLCLAQVAAVKREQKRLLFANNTKLCAIEMGLTTGSRSK